MLIRATSFIAALMFLPLAATDCLAAEQPIAPTPTGVPAASAKGVDGLSVLAALAPAATDLRKAMESLERLANSTDGLAAIAESTSKMSSEFDPFGHKTAFRAVGQQTKVIEQQQKVIFQLQEREIERLRSENDKLKYDLQKSRQRKKPKKRGVV